MILVILLLFLFFLPTNISAQGLKINEFLPNPTDSEKEWVEIRNESGQDLANYYLQDKVGNKKTLESITNCSGYSIWELNTESGEGWLNNSDQESIFLYDETETLVDSLESWESPSEGKTLSRIPNGDGVLKTTNPTKCADNYFQEEPTPTPTTEPKTTSSTTTAKSPSPTPKPQTSPKPSTQAKPTAEEVKNQPQVLGSSLEHSVSQLQNGLNPSPSSSPDYQSSGAKYAPFLIGSGVGLIGISFLLFYFYKKNLETNQISKGQERFKKDEDGE